MRKKLSVTNNEVEMLDGHMLVSTTDLKGIITSCNPEFIEISGYTEQELIGQPHNVVRHPDMPAAAFKDLWETVQEGNPWVGQVKNRCKNGDYYWVTANVTPLTENGHVTGYMSVRYKPSRAEVSAAEALYAQINAGKATLQGTGKPSMQERMDNVGIRRLFHSLMAILFVMFAAVSIFINNLLTHAGEGTDVTLEVFGSFIGMYALLFFGTRVMVEKKVLPAIQIIEEHLTELAEGNFQAVINIHREDRCGDALRSLKVLQIRQGFMVNDTQQQATRMLRIKTALDEVSSNVMIADGDFNIFYMNNAAQALMENAEKDFRKDLPNFHANQLVGTCIDVFHKDPSHQRRLLGALTSSYASKDMNIGGRVMRVVANPVCSESGDRVATVVEWIDRTEEVAVEKEVQGIVEAAMAGNLSERIATEDKNGFFAALSGGINALVDVSERVIDDTLRVLGAMSQGNLTESIDGDYEGQFGTLKENSNTTVHVLRDLIGKVRMTATDVSNGVVEIAGGNATLNDRTQTQAASLEETASSIEEMASTVQQNADNARQADQLAVDAREQAEQGGKIVSQAVVAMSGITESSNKISDIISVIDEIAFQTNLLALNAAVEAARAGEQGRGFAVVAGEVRALAQRSAEAAKEIKGLINASVESVNEGSELVDKSGEALDVIVQSVQKVSDIIAEIAAAGQEQASGIDQINQAIAQMDSVTQQNAALVEETTAASQTLEQQSNDMQKLVSAFELGDVTEEEELVAKKLKKMAAKAAVPKKAASKKTKVRANSKYASQNDDWEEF